MENPEFKSDHLISIALQAAPRIAEENLSLTEKVQYLLNQL